MFILLLLVFAWKETKPREGWKGLAGWEPSCPTPTLERGWFSPFWVCFFFCHNINLEQPGGTRGCGATLDASPKFKRRKVQCQELGVAKGAQQWPAGPTAWQGWRLSTPLSLGLHPKFLWLVNCPRSLQDPLSLQEAHPGLVPQLWALSRHPGRCGGVQGLRGW